MPLSIGTNYEKARGLTIVEIAKLVRKDIKTYIKENNLKGLKVSVTTEKYSGCRSLNAEIVKVPSNYGAITNEYLRATQWLQDYSNSYGVERYTPEFNQVIDDIKKIIESYNREDIDIQSDYFNVSYYSRVSIDIDSVLQSQEAVTA